uniref:LIM protein n=1 Tax=Haliotis discus discus TaxID=91233 RepID=B7U5G2_HALDI|nr:LIM protein [Haliotis discus discus]
MPFVPKEMAKCPKCDKSVYAAEERLAGGFKWHKVCFKCDTCNKALDSTNANCHEAHLYCRSCHGKQFGPKGYGFGGGAGALSTETGAQFGVKTGEMSNKPTQAVVGSTGTGPKCPRCGKSVYDAERAIGVNIPWHKSCFRCQDCKKAVDSTTMAMHEMDLFCKGCYGKRHGPKGFGFGGGAGALHGSVTWQWGRHKGASISMLQTLRFPIGNTVLSDLSPDHRKQFDSTMLLFYMFQRRLIIVGDI